MRNVADKLFKDLLGRSPSESAAKDWSRQLEEGVTRGTVASCLLRSEENRERLVRQFYGQLLDREPETESLLFWMTRLSSGDPQEEILAALLGGEEFFAKHGSTPSGYVRALFKVLMRRSASGAEIEAWAGLLTSHIANRQDVARDFLIMDEYRASLIKDWYWLFLRRQPDAETVTQWLSRWRAGATREEIQIGILSAREYLFTLSQ